MRLKYIVIEETFPVVFSEALIHADVGARYRDSDITSAGFVHISNGVLSFAGGRSESLNISSNENDADLIARCFGLMRI